MNASNEPATEDRSLPDRTLGDRALPDGVVHLIPGYLGRQRWYAGSSAPDAELVRLLDAGEVSVPLDRARLLWALVEAEDARYQLLVGERRAGEPADFLSGHENAVLGSAGEHYYYDATLDPELALRLVEVVTSGSETAERVRPVSVEQSNTSLVYDDRVIVKVFRRLLEGPNPDVEVTTALVAVGFEHVAAPVGVWRRDGIDLAYAQEFLAGGSEGWALALTSLRDLYSSSHENPADAGGDFAGEASRLGKMTADLHLALARAFPPPPATVAEQTWRWMVDGFEARLARLGAAVELDLLGIAGGLLERLEAVRDPGPVLRVHGDYHLGQVMRTDTGWYVLDFEGEPGRPLSERLAPSSALKDVAGMLRSFQYAAHFALSGRGPGEAGDLEGRAVAWELHNRAAFVEGYRSQTEVGVLLPGDDDYDAVLAAYELDKALYELDYERAYRPDWLPIPLAAIVRVLDRSPR